MLIKAKETDIRLLMINGIGRYGFPALMGAVGGAGESVYVGGRRRSLFLEQTTGDSDVANVSLAQARSALRSAFKRLPNLRGNSRNPSAWRVRCSTRRSRWCGGWRWTRTRIRAWCCTRGGGFNAQAF